MAITYPLAHPATPGFSRVTLKPYSTTAMSMSPFSGEQQAYLHNAEYWRMGVTLPPMVRADAETWIAFLLSLRGRYGTFIMGDPSGATPRGSAPNAPAYLDGAATARAATMATLGWTASQSNILLPGDYLQVCKNYVTFPRAFDNGAWTKNELTNTSTTIAAPNGAAEAEEFTPTGGATNAYIFMQAPVAPARVGGETFTWAVWLKTASGTPSINILIANQAGTLRSTQACALTASWQRFSVTATMDSADTNVRVFVGGSSTWPEADGEVHVWGGSLYSATLDARLHKNLKAANSDSNLGSTLDLWPRLREAHPDFSAVVTASAKGAWRLASNQAEWDINEAKHFGLGFEAMEAL